VFAVVSLGASGCSRSLEPHRFETVTKLDDSPRRAPAVAVDPTPGLPQSRSEAESDQTVVVLTTPSDVEQAREVVRRFFRAVLQEAPDRLEPLIAQNAWARTTSGATTDRALSLWQARLARLDYAALGGQVVYRDTEMETYQAEDIPRLAGRSFPISASDDAVVVRVPISMARAGRVQLFGNEIWFLLRPEDGVYRIAELVEDFQLP